MRGGFSEGLQVKAGSLARGSQAVSGHEWTDRPALIARYADATFNADAARLCGAPKSQAAFEAEADAIRLTLPAHVRDALKPLRD
jgi:hypothetical protein